MARLLIVAVVLVAACNKLPTGPSITGDVFVPRVFSVVPDFASSLVATPIEIRGEGFVPGATVSFGGDAVAAMVLSHSQLTVLAPPRAPGPTTLVVRNPDGRAGTFAGGFRFEAVEPVPVRMNGRIIAGAAEVPLAGATVELLPTVPATPVPAVVTDGDGRFELAGTLQLGSQFAALRITRAGIPPWMISVAPSETEPVIKLDLMLIRPGLTVRGDLQLDNAMWCTFESVACHRLVVDGPAGSMIDVEIVPEAGQSVGLIVDAGFLAPTEFPTRVRVAPRVMWVMGGLGRYTITAK